MKKLFLFVAAVSLFLQSCQKQGGYIYKIYYRDPHVFFNKEQGILAPIATYYITRNELTYDEEICLLFDIQEKIKQTNPDAFQFELSLDIRQDGAFGPGEFYTCPE